MPISIHGREYITVAERVKEIHDKEKTFSITSEVLCDNPVVVRATVVCTKGTFNGISAANPDKAIEKQSPYEVAETSAVGRALGFAGYGLTDDIATADEMVKAGVYKPKFTPTPRSITGKTLEQVVDSKGIHKCVSCGSPISEKVALYSLENYGKELCQEKCQAKFKKFDLFEKGKWMETLTKKRNEEKKPLGDINLDDLDGSLPLE